MAEPSKGIQLETDQNPVSRTVKSTRHRLTAGALLVVIYLTIAYVVPRPAALKPEAWRLLGIFCATIAGLMTEPLPGGALVLCAVTLASLVGGLSVQQALGGYADPTVWLVMSAFFISTALIKTGLARRIALFFVRAFGGRSIGICYSLALTDGVLATMIPANAARSGGVVLPIARSISELYGSYPGPTAALLGSFLMTGVYQSICVTAAMFLTGQASNPLAAQIATDTLGYPVSWASWCLAGIVPGVCSLLVAPYVVYRLNPPQIRHTPEAARFAAEELEKMGPMSRGQKTVAVIFALVCLSWATSSIHHVEIALPALLGSCVLLVSGVLRWEDISGDKTAWSIFIWYGGLLRLGRALADAGVTGEFAKAVSGVFGNAGWPIVLAGALLIYFYVHYAYASITAHMLAMFAPFASVLIAKGAPVGLVVFSFACFTNLAAGLTHYGTTPSPMYYAQNYVSFRTWWSTGFIVSLFNIAIWSTVGFGWWKLIGLW